MTLRITPEEVDEQGEDTPAFIAKHGAERQAEIAYALMALKPGNYNAKTLQKALDGLKLTP